ncbi:MAG: hypothetical protein A2014_05890 [Spirochaetes bacterium GWF1_49_6]|nr:MAG: hypothetical protein A2014_05890 [Spirochaetes bacterium GWF1_49_6]
MKNKKSTLRPISKKLAKLERDFFAAIKKTGESFLEDDIHKLRIRIRKLAAIFDIIRFYGSMKGIDKITKHFKTIFNDLQELRDKQVLIGMVSAMSAKYPETDDYLRGLIAEETLLHNKAWKSLKDTDIVDLRNKFDLLREAAANIPIEGALECASIAYKKALIAKRSINPSRIRTLHRCRIEFKKFRYIVEALADTLGIGKSVIARMSRYQDKLGLVQDLDVLSRNMKNFRYRGGKIDGAIKEIEQRKARAVEGFLRHADDISGFWKHRVESWITMNQRGE